jgi:hypothetical protein
MDEFTDADELRPVDSIVVDFRGAARPKSPRQVQPT